MGQVRPGESPTCLGVTLGQIQVIAVGPCSFDKFSEISIPRIYKTQNHVPYYEFMKLYFCRRFHNSEFSRIVLAKKLTPH